MMHYLGLLVIIGSMIYMFGQCHDEAKILVFDRNKFVDNYRQLYCDGGSAKRYSYPINNMTCYKICNRLRCDFNNNNLILDDIRIYCNTSCRMVYKLEKKK